MRSGDGKHRRNRFCFGLVGMFWLAGALALPAKEKRADAARVAPPVFSARGGASATNVPLTLSAGSPAAVIRWTLDGSEPDETSPVYKTSVLLTNSCVVRARAFAEGLPASAVAAETYTLLDGDLAGFNSNLPLVILNSFGSNITREQKAAAAVQIIDAGKTRATLTGPPDFSGPCLVNVRGRASLRYPKNSFTLKLTDGAGDPKSVPVLDFPADADWVLYAPFPDKTLMRDALAYELHRNMGHWAPRTRFVEVFVNQTGAKLSRRDYVGVYVLEEKIKRGKERVNIAKLKPDDDSEPRLTGGYLFKKDHVGFGGMPLGGGDLGGYPAFQGSSGTRAGFPTGPGGFPADSKGFQPAARSGSRSVSSSSSGSSRSNRGVVTNYVGRPPRAEFGGLNRESIFRGDDDEMFEENEEAFRTRHTNEFYFVEPEPDEITAVQRAWLKNHLNELEGALYGPDFQDPARGYAAFLDAESFIDYHLIVETTKNVDGFRFSVFFHKDRGGKIKTDPIWDWNLSFGNANGKQGWLAEFWLWPQLDDREYTWYRRLFEDPDFGQRYVDRWSQLRTNVLATAVVLARIDELAALLQEAQARNFARWPIIGRPVNPNYYVGASYAQELAWMRKFIQTRLDWIEAQFPPVPKVSLAGAANAGRNAALSAPAGQIHFTLDGSDPRARGGNVAPAARVYDGPVQLRRGTKLFARVRQENRWSGPLVFQEGE